MTPAEKSRFLSRLFLVILALILGWGVYVIMRPFLEVLIAAVVVTISFFPAYDSIHRFIRSPGLAALVTVLLLVVVLLVPVIYLGTTISAEIRDTYHALERDSTEEGGWSAWLSHHIDGPIQWIAARTGMAAPSIRNMLLEQGQRLSSAGLKWLSSLLANLTSTIGNIVFVLFITFFLFQQGHHFRRYALEYLPLDESHLTRLLDVMKGAIIANIYGMVAVGVAQGVLVGMAFAIVGLRSPVLWGLVASFVSLIPIVGTALVWVPAVIILLIAGAWWKAIFLIVWGTLIVGMTDNVLRPLVLKRGVELNTLTIFFALMGGVQVFGFIGLFAGPVIFTMALVVWKIVHEERIAWEDQPIIVDSDGRTVQPEDTKIA